MHNRTVTGFRANKTKRRSTANNEPTDYFRDKALDTKNDDRFKHSHYVEVLKDILLRSETPINVGLYGKWGVGKSSIVHMLKEAIEEDEKLKDFKYVEVDAWGLSNTSLQQGILEEINMQIGPVYESNDLEDQLYNTRQVDVFRKDAIKKSWWLLPLISAIVAPILIIGSLLDLPNTLPTAVLGAVFALLLKLFLGSSKRIVAKAASSIQFNKMYNTIIRQQSAKQNKKIVIVIDNLDRCNDKVAVELLGLIQTFMVKKNCINILACDDEALIRHLRNVKGEGYTDKDGNEFLSKFFQVTLRIPPFIGENLEEYTEGLMNSRSVEFNPFVRQILISGAVENPRKINQFLNNAVALYRLAELKERDQKLPQGAITQHTDFLTKMIIIRHEWPDVYKKIEEEPDILNDQEKFDAWLRQRDSDSHGVDRALERFLSKTQLSHVDDVAPFLRLNQESYAAESGIDEFGTAIATLDPVAVEIFSKADPQKHNQYLKKAEEVMDHNAERSDSLTLVNCALSLIRILKHVQDYALRKIALAILGKHLSHSILDQWDKFDLEKHGMVGLLAQMPPHFSRTFYEKMIAESFSKDKTDQELFAKFLRNGSEISSETMDSVDRAFSKVISEPLDNLEILAQCCNEYDWNQNNITKPSRTVSAVIESITFAPDGSDVPFITTYKKIKKRIAGSERGEFLRRVKELILQFTKGNQTMPESLVVAIQEISQNDLGENIEQKERIFETLAQSIKRIPDSGQRGAILDVLYDLAKKLNKTANVSCDIDGLLVGAAAQCLGDADGNMILSFLKKADSERADLLKSNAIMSALIERFAATNPGNEEILRLLLKITPAGTQNAVSEKFSELILSGEEVKYSALLQVAQELDEGFNPSIIDSVRKACMDAAAKDGSDRSAWYRHVLKLKPTFSEVDDIIKYAEELIQNNDYGLQDQGLELLQSVNSGTDQVTHNALAIAIEKSAEFLRTDLERMVRYLDFVFQYSDRWTYPHKRKLKELFQEGLKPGQAESSLNHIIANINRSTPEIIRGILDEIIDCAKQTSFDNVRKQLRDVLVNNKGLLGTFQKEKIKEIYGDIDLD